MRKYENNSVALFAMLAFATLALVFSTFAGCKSDNGSETATKTVEPPESPAPMPTVGSPTVEPPTDQSLAQPKLERATPVSEETRRLLAEPMRLHASDMRSIILAAIVLDFEGVQNATANMTSRPRVSRPKDMTEEAFQQSLPTNYIEEEDVLFKAAQSLEKAGEARDHAAMAKAYLEMTGTCIRCHGAYLDVSSTLNP